MLDFVSNELNREEAEKLGFIPPTPSIDQPDKAENGLPTPTTASPSKEAPAV